MAALKIDMTIGSSYIVGTSRGALDVILVDIDDESYHFVLQENYHLYGSKQKLADVIIDFDDPNWKIKKGI